MWPYKGACQIFFPSILICLFLLCLRPNQNHFLHAKGGSIPNRLHARCNLIWLSHVWYLPRQHFGPGISNVENPKVYGKSNFCLFDHLIAIARARTHTERSSVVGFFFSEFGQQCGMRMRDVLRLRLPFCALDVEVLMVKHTIYRYIIYFVLFCFCFCVLWCLFGSVLLSRPSDLCSTSCSQHGNHLNNGNKLITDTNLQNGGKCQKIYHISAPNRKTFWTMFDQLPIQIKL